MSKVIPPRERSSFFPKNKSNGNRVSNRLSDSILRRNNPVRKAEIEKQTKDDSKVTIPQAIRDFSRIKKIVDNTDNIDNSNKIARLKELIQNGSYKINYDRLADKLIEQEL